MTPEYQYVKDKTLQHESEFRAMVDYIWDRNRPRIILEIGTFAGGTAFVWAQLVGKAGRVICVDKKFSRPTVYETHGDKDLRARIVEIESESTKPATVRRVALLAGDGVDLLFIDGNHTQNISKQDYDNYARFVRRDGWIAFHDALNPAWSVRLLWQEVKMRSRHWEFVYQRQKPESKKSEYPNILMGIGLMRKG